LNLVTSSIVNEYLKTFISLKGYKMFILVDKGIPKFYIED